MLNRFILDRLRQEQHTDKTPQNNMDIVQTKFEDNHGVVISGSGNNVHIHMNGGHIATIDAAPAAATEIPAALASPAAQALLHKAQAANLLDAELRPTGSNTMAALVASEIAERLKLYPKWRPFEELWGVQNLSKTYSAAMDQSQTNRRIDEIRKALK